MTNINITLKNNTQTEEQAKNKLITILNKYDLSEHIYTNSIVIEDGIIPHSHPVLSLNSFPYSDENIILDTFIHEQLHWKFDTLDNVIIDNLVNELSLKYPNAPWGYPLGCIDQKSTYLHLALCRLSNNILATCVGNDAANRVLYYQQNHHYIWVYQTLEKDKDYLNQIINKYIQ